MPYRHLGYGFDLRHVENAEIGFPALELEQRIMVAAEVARQSQCPLSPSYPSIRKGTRMIAASTPLTYIRQWRIYVDADHRRDRSLFRDLAEVLDAGRIRGFLRLAGT